MMKRQFFAMAAGFLFLAAPLAANAGVNLNIGINLPGIAVQSPPETVVIPGSYVYVAPDLDVDLFFYGGFWWRPYNGVWFRAVGYNGPWKQIVIERVPRPVLSAPPHYRHFPPGHERVPYGQLKKHWRQWEKERHWEHVHHRGDMREDRDRRDDPRDFRGNDVHEDHNGPGRGHGRGNGHGNGNGKWD